MDDSSAKSYSWMGQVLNDPKETMVNSNPRKLIWPSMAVLAGLTAGGPLAAATGTVTCTISVGGKPSASKSFALDESGSGRQHFYFEANMYSADVKIEAASGQVKAGIELRQESPQASGSFNEYGVLRGVAPGPASQEITLLNAKLRCDLM